MNREEYIQYRKRNDVGIILFNYWNENVEKSNMDYKEFLNNMENWFLFLSKNDIFQMQAVKQELSSKILKYYDDKFNIVMLTDKDTLIDII